MEVSERISHYGSSVTSELKKVGERIGRFEIVNLLTVTLLGPLYRVRVSRGVGVRLLQVIPSALGKDEQLRKQLAKQVEQLASIESELFLKPQEIVEFEDSIAIQYADWSGQPLSTVRRKAFAENEKAIMSPPQVKSLIQRVILSLESAATKQVHHYGITPDFILYEESGAIKLWGLGVLQSVSRRKFEIFISSAIIPLQNEQSDDLNYTVLEALSPEWRNDEPADVRSDLYSLGVLGHNLLAGHIRDVAGGEDANLDTEIPPGWAVYLARLLESDPVVRYQTTTAVATDLERVENLHLGPQRPNRLDRVPLPKSIERRVDQKTGRFLRFAALSVLALGALATAYLLYQVQTLDTTTAPPAEIFAAGEKAPQLILRVSPQNAQVRFMGDGGATFLTSTGELRLVGKQREFIGLVNAPRHSTQRFTVTLGDQPQTLDINLEIAWGKLRLQAPPGSRLDIEQASGERSFLDFVPDGGQLEVTERLFADTYTFVVSRPGHEPVVLPQTALAEGTWTELVAQPKPLPASLKVVSNPTGLPVQIDGRPIGQTPLILENLFWPEPVKVLVGGGQLRTREKDLLLFPGRENVLDFGNVEAAQGDLQLAVSLLGRDVDQSVLEGLRITVDNQVYTSLVDLQVSLTAGTHTVRVEHPDYLPRGGTVTIEDEALKHLAVDLRPRPATVSVALPTARTDYWVEWDGNRQPLNDAKFQAPAGEPLRITLGSPDHYPTVKDFLLPANGLVNWEPELRSLPGPSIGQPWAPPNLALTLVWIAPGKGQFGSPVREAQRRPNEDELTQASFSQGFWIGATEVTQQSYLALMPTNPSVYKSPDKPVDSVSWVQASEFCQRLTEKERELGRLPPGYRYRLPTEAEWEYAARAGTTTPFSFGDRADGSESNFIGEYPRDYDRALSNTGLIGSVTVGSFAPNPWGLYDMAGNVAEWALDAYNDRLPGGSVKDYVRKGAGRGRPIRGGAWTDPADRCRCASRDSRDPDHQASSIGFRIVLARDLGHL